MEVALSSNGSEADLHLFPRNTSDSQPPNSQVKAVVNLTWALVKKQVHLLMLWMCIFNVLLKVYKAT